MRGGRRRRLRVAVAARSSGMHCSHRFASSSIRRILIALRRAPGAANHCVLAALSRSLLQSSVRCPALLDNWPLRVQAVCDRCGSSAAPALPPPGTAPAAAAAACKQTTQHPPASNSRQRRPCR